MKIRKARTKVQKKMNDTVGHENKAENQNRPMKDSDL